VWLNNYALTLKSNAAKYYFAPPPPPHTESPHPLLLAAEPSRNRKRTLVKKEKGKPYMVEEPSHVKHLSQNHM
jgi:hypothetical protein